MPEDLVNVVAIAGGSHHSLALKADGTVVGWGYNGAGQVNVPIGLSNVIAIAAGMDSSLALKADGTLVAWGRDRSGPGNSPSNLTDVVAIAVGAEHAVALRQDGTAIAWGENRYGQLQMPSTLSNAVAIATTSYHTLALLGDGSPEITVHPWSRTVRAGDAVSFTMKAVGASPLIYQWQLNGTDIPHETNATLTIATTHGGSAGMYRAIVCNSRGSSTSRPALLRLEPSNNEPPLVILNQPQSGQVFASPANIQLQAYAQDKEDGFNLQVEFFEGTNSLGLGTFVPSLCPSPFCPYFALTWPNVAPGDYTLTAKVTDRIGASTVSSPIHITVRSDATPNTLILPNAVWRYLDNGSDQGTAWRQPTFNDSTWAAGSAQLGYGDGDEATVVGFGSDPANKYITTYFRRSFVVGNVGTITGLTARLIYDDGAVVYLNGTEVFRVNLPAGPIINTTVAPTTPPDNALFIASISPDLLMGGTNVMAVEVHQSSPASSDLSFQLELTALTGTNQPPRPAPREQEKPAVAANGSLYLVVWADNRNFNANEWDIYGARVTPEGRVLDPNGIRICTLPGIQNYPSVASDGRDFLVVWNDNRDEDRTTSYDIYAARVTGDGVVIETNGFPVSRAPNAQFFPSVAFNGTQYLAAWYDYRNSDDRPRNDIYGARISRGGAVLDAESIPICTADDMQWAPGVAALAGDFFVAWDDSRSSIRGTRVGANGSVDHPDGLVLSPNFSGYPIRVAANSSGYLTVWTDSRDYPATRNDIFARRANASGELTGADLVLCNAPEGQVGPAVAALGEEFLAVWLDDRLGPMNTAIFGTRIAPGGALDPNGILIGRAHSSSAFNTPSVAGLNGQYLVVWVGGTANVSGETDIVGARLSADGTLMDANAFLVSTLLASDPVVTWPAPASITYGTPLSTAQLNAHASVTGVFEYDPPLGVVLGAGKYTLTLKFTPQDRDNYNIAYASVGLEVQPAPLTIRADSKTKLQGTQNPPLTASYSGLVADDTPADLDTPVTLTTTATASSPSGVYPIVASDASDANYAITHVNGTLTVLAFPPSAEDDQTYPAIASDGTGYLVVWMDRRDYDSSEYDIYGARVSGTGQLLDPGGIPICTVANYQWYPAVAFDGANYLVVWSDSRDNSAEHPSLELYGARVSRNGTVLDANGFQITHGEVAYQPTVAFNDSEYLVAGYAWEHNGHRGSTLLGVRVTPDGSVRDTEELVIHQSDGLDYPAIVASLGNDWLVAWNGEGVEGVRVSRSGNVSTPHHLVSEGETWVHGLAAAGSNYFLTTVAIRQLAADSYVLDVLGTWISADGQPLNTVLIAANTNLITGSHLQPTTYVQDHPTAVANGSDVLVVWEAGAMYTNGGLFMFLSDIRGARVGAAGATSPIISICAAPQDQSYPAIAFNGQHFLAVWQDARTAPPEEYSPLGQFDIYGARLTTAGGVIENNGFLISGVRSDHPDSDNDGVPDDRDQCPNTLPNDVVNANGCSIAQLCPCDDSPWRNHADYVRCVIDQAWRFYRQGLIAASDRRLVIGEAARSNCGRHEGAHLHLQPQTREEIEQSGRCLIACGETAGVCVLECSTDLLHWTPIQTVTLPSAEMEVVDTESGHAAVRFYRIRLAP